MDFIAGARVLAGTRVALIAEVDATVPGALSIVAGPEGTVTGSIAHERANRRRVVAGQRPPHRAADVQAGYGAGRLHSPGQRQTVD